MGTIRIDISQKANASHFEFNHNATVCGIDSTLGFNHFDRWSRSPSLLDMIGMYRLISSFRVICRVVCACIPIAGSAAALDAYYTRLPIPHDDPISKVGCVADVVVRVDGERQIEFSRASPSDTRTM